MKSKSDTSSSSSVSGTSYVNAAFDEGVPNKGDISSTSIPTPTAPADDNPENGEVLAGGPERDNWNSPIEFLLSCISMSVGLGNIWRFPSVAYENGGGAFLIPYFIILFFIGRPLYFLEMILGQFSSSGSVKVWDIVPFAKGIGYGQAIATWCVVTYYVFLMALAVFYFICSFFNPLPWAFCDPEWADLDNCYDVANDSLGDVNLTGKISSSEYFFTNYVIKKIDNIDNGVGDPDWRLSLCLLLSWIMIFAVMAKGISSSGKVAYFTALFPYVVLITLLVRGCTLPGAGDGILYLIEPQWEKLLTPDVWYAAVTQCFFSLSVGFGPIVTFASYNPFRHPIYRDSTIVSFCDTGTSILASITIFSILGNLAYETNQPIDKVVSGGTALAFISYPAAIAKFDAVPQLFGVLFFLMLMTLAIGSAAGLTGCVITIICDELPHIKRWIVTLCVCIAGFFIGLVYTTPGGLYIFDLIDYFGGGFIIYVMVIAQAIFIFWIYGLKQLAKDVRFMLGFGIGIYWKLTWSIIIPVFLLVIFVYAMVKYEPLATDNGNPYPPGVTGAGWAIAAIAILQIPFWGGMALRKQAGTFFQRFKSSFKPSEEWGPKDPKTKNEYIAYNQQHVRFSWIPNPKWFKKN